jgi:hypothetical protein
MKVSYMKYKYMQVSNICDWSYIHRAGNGELSARELQERINTQFYKLREIEDET